MLNIIFFPILALLLWGLFRRVAKEYGPLLGDDPDLNNKMLEPLIQGFLMGVVLTGLLSIVLVWIDSLLRWIF